MECICGSFFREAGTEARDVRWVFDVSSENKLIVRVRDNI